MQEPEVGHDTGGCSWAKHFRQAQGGRNAKKECKHAMLTDAVDLYPHECGERVRHVCIPTVHKPRQDQQSPTLT
jgi:hypothetical protein